MYKLTDNIEIGHNDFIGGTINISFTFDHILTENDKQYYLDLIDSLDHSIIAQDKNIIEYSTRYFILDKTKTFFEDVVTILNNIRNKNFTKPIECSIELGKEKYITTLKSTSKLISYCTEG